VQAIGKKFGKWANHQYEEAGLGLAAPTPGSGCGKIKGDSYNASEFMFEFKSERHPNWKGNINQARQQAKTGNFYHNKWVLIQRDPETTQDNPQAFAVLDYIEFLNLLKKNQEPRIKVQDKEMKWKLERLVDAAKRVIKELEP
jgi:hypothetical protein